MPVMPEFQMRKLVSEDTGDFAVREVLDKRIGEENTPQTTDPRDRRIGFLRSLAEVDDIDLFGMSICRSANPVDSGANPVVFQLSRSVEEREDDLWTDDREKDVQDEQKSGEWYPPLVPEPQEHLIKGNENDGS